VSLVNRGAEDLRQGLCNLKWTVNATWLRLRQLSHACDAGAGGLVQSWRVEDDDGGKILSSFFLLAMVQMTQLNSKKNSGSTEECIHLVDGVGALFRFCKLSLPNFV
jgi:hypothetical protein